MSEGGQQNQNILAQQNIISQSEDRDGQISIQNTAQENKFVQENVFTENNFQQNFTQALTCFSNKLMQENKIENRIAALKGVHQKIQQSKSNQHLGNIMSNWIKEIKLLEKHLHDDAHVQVLRKMPLIVKFMYEKDQLTIEWIQQFIMSGLSSHDQYVKVVQFLIRFLKIQDLKRAFKILGNYENPENQHFVELFYAIIGNKYLSEDHKKKIQQKNELILQEIYEKQPQNKLENSYHTKQSLQIQEQKEIVNTQEEDHFFAEIKNLSIQIFEFLVQLLSTNISLFSPILNKLITSKYNVLSVTLVHTIINLFKSNKHSYLWLLQHCLRIDFRQISKQKNVKNAIKLNFLQKLANEGVYQYTVAILARNRFNKLITQKALTVIILMSKNLKPLEKIYTEYIWKVLGLNSRDQKQREQFFSFVRDSLRNQKSFTEESVDYIYFQILMKMNFKWYSVKIFQCLQLLFMRLNEDLKYLSYSNQSYTICNPDLIGLQKFWYIYFYTNDLKVCKKIKQFLWKLATYSSNYEVRYQLFQKYMNRILRCMVQSSSQQKHQLTIKGFQIIEKLLEQFQKKQTNNQYLQLNIRNQTTQAIPPKNISVTISQKSCLSHLREQISQAISPSLINIRLLLRGQFLKGEKMTLKQLSIHSGQTIMVIDQQMDDQTAKRQKQLVVQNTKQLIQIFGQEMGKQFLQFIAQKMQGQNIDKIMNSMMDQEKMMIFQEQYKDKKNKQQAEKDKKSKIIEEVIPAQEKMIQLHKQSLHQMNQKNSQFKFSVVLGEEPQNIKMLLSCAQQCHYMKGWSTIKKIPICQQQMNRIRNLAENSQWQFIFPREQQQQIFCVYQSYVLKNLFKNEEQICHYMIKKDGLKYIFEWLPQLLDSENMLLIECITDILRISLFMCGSLIRFRRRQKEKLYNSQLLNQLIQQNFIEQHYSQLEDTLKLIKKQTIQKVLNFMVNMANHENKSSISLNIGHICLFLMDNFEYATSKVIQMSHNEVLNLLIQNNYIGQYIIIYGVAKKLDNKDIQKQKLLLAQIKKVYQNLFTICDSQKDYLKSLYDLVTCLLLAINPEQCQIRKKIIKESMKLIRQSSHLINHSQFSGILQLMRVCLIGVYQVNNISNTQLQGQLSQFSQWVFNNLLFSLDNPHPLIREKQIRKICYEIIDIITNYQEGLMIMICQYVININIEPRPKDQDYLDFKKAQYLGLTNLGATCYINSLLQQVYHTKFSQLILEQSQQMMGEVLEPSNRINQLKKLFMRLFSSIKNVVNPRSFINSISFYGQPINTSVQQDATQFLLCLFDFIQSEGYQKQIYEVFGGNLCNQITAQDESSSFVKNNIQHFNSIGIDIKGKKNLHQALAYFIKPQILDGENMYYCEEIGKKTRASKRTFIENMPNILLITLKRFQFDYETQSRSKLNDYFQFPFELDMHKFSAEYIRQKKDTSDSKYKLSGILIHSGSAESGHYYSFIKKGQKWYEFNDKYVSQTNPNNIKNQCFGCTQGRKNHNAYMLFYEKVDSGYHGVYLDSLSDGNSLKKQVTQQNSQFLKNRLVYDQNFITFVKNLYLKSMDDRILTIKELIEGKKSDNNPVVHFDMDNQIGPFKNDEAIAGGVVDDDFLVFDPPSAF